ncbi:hypothetical protein BH24PSE2_BH24PSE2_06740 [soil metagenome]
MKTIRKLNHRKLACLLALSAVTIALAAPATFADLRKVEQTVYGMDCAPCAYGVEKGIGKLDGVQRVKVSLNDGTAVVELAEANEIGIADIRQVVSDGGFTPKQARVEIAGTLAREDGKLQLMTGGGTGYRLAKGAGAEDVWKQLQTTQNNTRLVLEGIVPADDAALLEVESLSAV